MRPKKEIILSLVDSDYQAFRQAIGSMHPFKTPGQVVRALVDAYVRKHDGIGIRGYNGGRKRRAWGEDDE